MITYPEGVSDPGVSGKEVRRKLTGAYKVRILREADRCTGRDNWGICFVGKGCIHQILSVGGARWFRGLLITREVL